MSGFTDLVVTVIVLACYCTSDNVCSSLMSVFVPLRGTFTEISVTIRMSAVRALTYCITEREERERGGREGERERVNECVCVCLCGTERKRKRDRDRYSHYQSHSFSVQVTLSVTEFPQTYFKTRVSQL